VQLFRDRTKFQLQINRPLQRAGRDRTIVVQAVKLASDGIFHGPARNTEVSSAEGSPFIRIGGMSISL
jgi:hypothetical protein